MGKEWDTAISFLEPRLQEALQKLPESLQRETGTVQLRRGLPVAVKGTYGIRFVQENGRIGNLPTRQSLQITGEELESSFRRLCDYSVYYCQNQIREGFLTIRGGHRVGLCGTAVCTDGRVTSVRELSGLHIRIAREIPGIAAKIYPHAVRGGILIAGAPGSGKTTVLRDLARLLSGADGNPPHSVAVIDERSELAGCWQGNTQCDLGPCCDVLDGYPKAVGMLQAVRTLTPEYLICDEIGTAEEAAAIETSLNAGVCSIASLHGGSLRELQCRNVSKQLLQSGAFAAVVLLDSGARRGTVRQIIRTGELLHETAGITADFSDRSLVGDSPLDTISGTGGILAGVS